MRFAFCICAVVLAAAAGLAAESKPAWQMEWEKTLAAAEKEGQLTAYIFDSGPLTRDAVQTFERAYPKIKVDQLRGRGSDLGPRIIAERRAGKFLADVFAGGKGTAYATLYPGKALDPIKSLLLLPEVLDETKWWQGKHKYVDPEGRYILAYVGNGGGATDPRVRGMDTPVLFFYYHSKLGPELKSFMARWT